MLVVLLGLGEVGCQLGEGELGEVDDMAQLDELFRQLRTAVGSHPG